MDTTLRRGWLGAAVVALSCGLACAATALTPWLWPVAMGAAWLGAHRMIAARGCSVDAACAPDAGRALLEPQRRRARLRMGLSFLAAAAALGAVAACDFPAVWPLAAVALWFAVSFIVAARTGYAGCPEIGAVASWVGGRHVRTRCPDLERADRRRSR